MGVFRDQLLVQTTVTELGDCLAPSPSLIMSCRRNKDDLDLTLQVNKMGFNEKGTGDPLTFTLIDKTPGSDVKFHVQAPNAEVYHNWCMQIRSILDMQKDLMEGRWCSETISSLENYPFCESDH